MSAIEYPASLPCPQTSIVTPVDRRATSDPERPREARALQRDRLELERITFPPMNATKSAAFREWWRNELTYGGSWFAATWPLPRGMVTAVRRFLEPPRWAYLGNEYWKISALCEVRGRGELPQGPCIADILYVPLDNGSTDDMAADPATVTILNPSLIVAGPTYADFPASSGSGGVAAYTHATKLATTPASVLTFEVTVTAASWSGGGTGDYHYILQIDPNFVSNFRADIGFRVVSGGLTMMTAYRGASGGLTTQGHGAASIPVVFRIVFDGPANAVRWYANDVLLRTQVTFNVDELIVRLGRSARGTTNYVTTYRVDHLQADSGNCA